VNSKQAALAAHRSFLLARSDEQRAQLSFYFHQFDRPVLAAQSGIALARSVWRSPLLITGLTLALTKTPWRRLARIPRWVWRGWKTYQFVRGWAEQARRAMPAAAVVRPGSSPAAVVR
jgi:hypothetical protein